MTDLAHPHVHLHKSHFLSPGSYSPPPAGKTSLFVMVDKGQINNETLSVYQGLQVGLLALKLDF